MGSTMFLRGLVGLRILRSPHLSGDLASWTIGSIPTGNNISVAGGAGVVSCVDIYRKFLWLILLKVLR